MDRLTELLLKNKDKSLSEEERLELRQLLNEENEKDHSEGRHWGLGNSSENSGRRLEQGLRNGKVKWK